MPKKTQTDRAPKRAPDRSARIGVTLAGLAAAALWCGLYLFVLAPAPAGALALVGQVFYFLLPLALIGMATMLAHRVQELAAEAAALRKELSGLRVESLRAGTETRPARVSPAPPPAAAAEEAPMAVDARPLPAGDAATAPVAPPQRPAARAAAPADNGAAPRPAPDAASAARPAPAPAAGETGEDLSLPDLIRALHFPETPEDVAGFRALQRALRHHKAGQVVQAAQDMLTLLSQDGLYMDDLAVEPAAPAIWRQLAAGDRPAAAAALASAGSDAAVRACAEKLRGNTVYRDTAQHFLRRFDRMLADMVPEISDEAVEALAATRSARAFLLVGSAAGVFEPA